MRRNNKALYEKIMCNVSKEVKRSLNESNTYKYHPKTRKQLEKIIEEHFAVGNGDLNDIDVSAITNFSDLFNKGAFGSTFEYDGNIDVSKWDVSNGTRFDYMFAYYSNFNCDLSQWDVSNGKNFEFMFAYCTKLKTDISLWDFSNATKLKEMFYKCNLKNIKISATFNNNGQNGFNLLKQLIDGAYCTGENRVSFSIN